MKDQTKEGRFLHYRNRNKKHAIASMKLDAPTGLLQVTFRRKDQPIAVYAYAGVDRATFDAFCDSPSKGVYFNRNIKGVFKGGCIRG